MYRHKADALSIKLQLDIVEALKPVGNPTGANQYSEKRNGSDATIPKKQERGSDYLLARIKRDRPDIAQRLSDGEFKSVP